MTEEKNEFCYEDFPQVYKAKMGNGKMSVSVIYRNHSEFYEQTSTYYGEKDAKYNPYDEIEMIMGNGGKRVHGKKTVKVVTFNRD